MKILFTDLDGTLLDDEHSLSIKNSNTLEKLQKEDVVRVVATGRSLYSAQKVLPADFPIDYLIFSTGAGIMNWQTEEIFFKKNIPERSVMLCSGILVSEETNFMLHSEIPDSHYFFYYRGDYTPADFQYRIELYSNFARPFDLKLHAKRRATQFLCILTPEKFALSYQKLQATVPGVSIIKTSSPLLKGSLWLEIYAEGVSKGHAAGYLADHLGIPAKESMAVGNDFNDLDLLEWSADSFVVRNSPQALKEVYKTVADNQNNGFSEAVNYWLKNS